MLFRSVQRGQSYWVVAGGIYSQGDKVIGKGVVVPHAFYKIVVNNQTGEAAGWMFPHTAPYPNLGNDLTKFRVSVADIQKEAGVQYHFPANAKELNPGQEWKVDFGQLTTAKRAKCGANASAD